MKFKEHYQELLTEQKRNLAALSEKSVKLLDELTSPNKWIEAMSVCEAAVDVGMLDDNILHLREEMFLCERELHSGINLDDENYADWFVQLVDFHHKLADAGVAEAWVGLSKLYYNARYPYRDYSKSEKCMLKGVSLETPLAIAVYGYQLYIGTGIAKVNKDKGQELMLRAKEKNFKRADTYLLLTAFDSDIDPNVLIQKIEEHNSVSRPAEQLWHLLGNVYRMKLNDIEKAVETYNKGIDIGEPSCIYAKASLILRNDIDGDTQEALRMLEKAYEWNITFAANTIGEYYLYGKHEHNIELAIEWYRKAIAYYDLAATMNLAMIYLHEDGYINLEEGEKYIDMAIEEGEIFALYEKANLLLDYIDDNDDDKQNKISQAKELLERAYDHGDGYAAYRLGYGYHNAEFSEEPDYEIALKYYHIGAERDCVLAFDLLGHCYKHGIGVEPDPEKAVEYYNRAIELGSYFSTVELAMCYALGSGVEQNHDEAVRLLNLAAAKDYTPAYLKLGYIYLQGISCEPDMDKAFRYFSCAVENGNYDAMYNLGQMYQHGIGCVKNPELAMEYIEKAANNGDADANIEMGLLYESKYGSPDFDDEKMIMYMTRAANKEHPYAQYKLGIYYFYGIVEQDIKKVLHYLTKAYQNNSPHAALMLGNIHLYELVENANNNEAFKYYQDAAEQDYINEGIGLCYRYGIGVERNNAVAFKYLTTAAGRNHTAAKYRLGECYKYGLGTTKNLSEAYRWMSQAAEEGSQFAEYEVSMMLLHGEGVAMNQEKGMEWLRKSANNEYHEAQFELGNCYLSGQGVDEDDVQAMYWYQKAAENGNEQAQKIIGKRNNKRR
jgi:TPR repeat protein